MKTEVKKEYVAPLLTELSSTFTDGKNVMNATEGPRNMMGPS